MSFVSNKAFEVLEANLFQKGISGTELKKNKTKEQIFHRVYLRGGT